MRRFNENYTVIGTAVKMLENAWRWEFGKGSSFSEQAKLEECKGYHVATGTLILLTRDSGCHSCGWWKNPDYERCLHLSISFRDPKTILPRSYDHKEARPWVEAVFASNKNMLWIEPPYSTEGKFLDVWHYRLFYAPGWAMPILPRKEVYSKDYTPAGWLSFSDLQEKLNQEQNKQAERLAEKLSL